MNIDNNILNKKYVNINSWLFMILDIMTVRCHLLSKVLATQFVSAHFFRAWKSAAAHSRRGLNKDSDVYAVSVRCPVVGKTGRHNILCIDFATLFVSAFSFLHDCAWPPDVAGVWKSGDVYAVSASGPVVGQAAGSVKAIRSVGWWTTLGFEFSQRKASPYVRKFNI